MISSGKSTASVPARRERLLINALSFSIAASLPPACLIYNKRWARARRPRVSRVVFHMSLTTFTNLDRPGSARHPAAFFSKDLRPEKRDTGDEKDLKRRNARHFRVSGLRRRDACALRGVFTFGVSRAILRHGYAPHRRKSNCVHRAE